VTLEDGIDRWPTFTPTPTEFERTVADLVQAPGHEVTDWQVKYFARPAPTRASTAVRGRTPARPSPRNRRGRHAARRPRVVLPAASRPQPDTDGPAPKTRPQSRPLRRPRVVDVPAGPRHRHRVSRPPRTCCDGWIRYARHSPHPAAPACCRVSWGTRAGTHARRPGQRGGGPRTRPMAPFGRCSTG
jgi:hypothetical protein